jgi:hypothetical protein
MEPLALKDIHLPPPLGMDWPAPGWWLVAGALLLVAGLVMWGLRRHRRQRASRIARQQLAQLQQQASQDPQACLAALSQLLKRLAMTTAPRQTVAGLSGAAWLAYLDHGLADAPFSQGVGRCLAAGPYQVHSAEAIDWPALFALCQRWIKRQARATTRKSLQEPSP